MDNPFGDVIGIQFLDVSGGEARTELLVAPHLLNPFGVVHGGVLFALADTTMGAALYSCLTESETCSTIEIKINFLRPVANGLLGCESTVVYQGRTTAVMEATVSIAGKMVARAQGTFAIISRS